MKRKRRLGPPRPPTRAPKTIADGESQMRGVERLGEVYRFAPDADGCNNLARTAWIALLACSIADQQRAGFGAYLDLREVHCPKCRKPGFNTGWGFWRFTCGAELSGEDAFKECENKS